MLYKLKAESEKDIQRFAEKAKENIQDFCTDYLQQSSVELVFQSYLPIDEVMFLIKQIKDSHEMYKTVKLVSIYLPKPHCHI